MIRARHLHVSVKTILLLVLTSLTVSLPLRAHADVTLPTLLADHMVIQRGLPVHVWGMAAPNELVTVTFRGETKPADRKSVV